MKNIFNALPKCATIYGHIASYEKTRDGFSCIFKHSGAFLKADLCISEIASFHEHDYSKEAMTVAQTKYKNATIRQLNYPLAIKALDTQVRPYDPAGYHCGWKSISHNGYHIGYFNYKENVLVILHEEDLYKHTQKVIQVDSGGFNLKGVHEVYKLNLVTPAKYGFVSDHVNNIAQASEIAQKIREFYRSIHTLTEASVTDSATA
ncbi:hypothetical protein [Vibrio sp. R78045]|uniref:hypothetical protein n=1 Tax=Vibrio sp. R78045 TaxID=3093868 RepID=UPI0036F22833